MFLSIALVPMNLSVACRVPQGSVLRQLLLLNFIYDLFIPNVSKQFLTFYLFADDTDIYYESSDLLTCTKNSKQRTL